MARLNASIALCVLAIATGCGGRDDGPVRPGSAESGAAACSDGRDNDADGFIDCSDGDCATQPSCRTDGGIMTDAGPARDFGPPRDLGPPIMCTGPIDLVFVLDVSTSMTDEVGRVRTGLRSIADAARALTADTNFSLVVFVDDAVAEASCAPFASIDALEAAFDRWQSFCSSNRQPAGGGDDTNSDCAENSLDAIYLAANTCPWRTDATRILIHVTDDTFAERPAVLSGSPFGGGGIPVQRTYDEVVTELRRAEVRVGAFAAPGAGEECGAGMSANVGEGFHEPYRGRDSLPVATGGQVWSIRDVRAGTLDMATAINEMVSSEYCTLY